MFVPIPIQKIKKDVPAPVIKKKSQLEKEKQREKEEQEEAAKGGGGGEAPGGKGGRPGDWKCAKCNYSNFASR